MDFEDIKAEDFESAETPEVAEPDETKETSAETQEVATPDSTAQDADTGKTDADARFAQMRREREEAIEQAEQARKEREALEKELAELKAQQEAREEVLSDLNIDDIDAIADATGISREEVISRFQEQEESARRELELTEKDLEIERLQEELSAINAEKDMQKDLATLQKIDPTIKSLEDLGDSFANYIGAGLSAEEAYFAIKGRDLMTKSTPPKEIGTIKPTNPEKTFFTEDEVMNMSSEQRTANAEKIMESFKHWR